MINSVHLLGHVGQAPQIKRTEKGQRYPILSLATLRRWKVWRDNLDEKSGDQDENCRSPSVLMIAAGVLARKQHLPWD